MRINEIQVKISYHHRDNRHILNLRDFQLKMPPFISHGTLATFRKMLETYETHSRRNVISQIPDLFMRKIAQFTEKVKDMKVVEDYSEDLEQTTSFKQEMKLAYAREIVLGNLST